MLHSLGDTANKTHFVPKTEMERIKKLQKNHFLKGDIVQFIRKQGVKNAVFLITFLHLLIIGVLIFVFEVFIYVDMTKSINLSIVVYLATGPFRLYILINLIHQLDNLSMTDNLTSAYNRRFLMMQLGKKVILIRNSFLKMSNV